MSIISKVQQINFLLRSNASSGNSRLRFRTIRFDEGTGTINGTNIDFTIDRVDRAKTQLHTILSAVFPAWERVGFHPQVSLIDDVSVRFNTGLPIDQSQRFKQDLDLFVPGYIQVVEYA